jgi:3-deoxy-D-manno-octulosonic acid (KDO) 8-phosphate synthase
MHAVPHTLAAVGVQKGEHALKNSIQKCKEYMDRANNVAMTGEKPASFVGINMLVDLDSLQELEEHSW